MSTWCVALLPNTHKLSWFYHITIERYKTRNTGHAGNAGGGGVARPQHHERLPGRPILLFLSALMPYRTEITMSSQLNWANTASSY